MTKTRQGKSPKTIRNHLGVLQSIFELGQRGKWCARNPVNLGEGPKVRHNQMRIRFLNQEKLEALLPACYPDDRSDRSSKRCAIEGYASTAGRRRVAANAALMSAASPPTSTWRTADLNYRFPRARS
ncbi:MAG: hypothetical protein M3N47_03110 [Chloroflexota bacterium]|nr:hypothetical protein [Chloroflexota bacterium]